VIRYNISNRGYCLKLMTQNIMEEIHTLDLPVMVPVSIDLNIFPRIIEHIPTFHILYCHQCKQVCFPSSLSSHLFEIHKIPAVKRRPIIQFCQTLDVVNTAQDLTLPADWLPALGFLPLYSGYSCSCCRFLLSSRKVVKTHLITIHGIQYPLSQTKINQVQIQS
jgi:hypothetical protein